MPEYSLDKHLKTWSGTDTTRAAAASTIRALASACHAIADVVAAGPLAGNLTVRRHKGVGGDFQTELDVQTNALLVEALRRAPVAAIASEEMDAPLPLAPGAPVVVAVDPLDGSSNIETNVSVGTIFSLLPTPPGSDGTGPAAFLRAGREQIAAGYAIYGPQTALVLTLGSGTDIFTLDRTAGGFVRTSTCVQVPARSREFAINASNYRHWDPAVRTWFDDCVAGTDGPRGEDFNMRWIASMVAEAHRILVRGGVYVYPGDARQGYRRGRLRLVYEANPVAFLMEQAGGHASTGHECILDCVPRLLHERVPLVFGAHDEVARLERYHRTNPAQDKGSPLFGQRGLFV